MANTFIKPTKVAALMLGLLEREVVLPGLVWTDTGLDFAGAANDTVSIRVPAYVEASSRNLRADSTITYSEDLTETKVDVTLSKDVYSAKAVTDEQLTLDIDEFGAQVLSPMVSATGRGVEDILATAITGATYETELELDATDPYDTVIDARTALNKANVPQGGRALLLGADVENRLLKAELIKRADQSGTDSALREASLGTLGGFATYSSNAIPPDEAYAFHRTAFVLATRAPVAPQGATWTAQQSYAGMAMRVLRDYDPTKLKDRIITNVYVGAKAVTDEGALDADGIFVPDAAEDPIFVRAVKIALGASS